MTYAVVTTFSPKGYEVYGRKMIETFAMYWPENVPLYAFYEGQPPGETNPRAFWQSIDADKERERFLIDHKDRDDPLDYRKNAVRYCHKVFAMTGAPRNADNLIWLDADCETFAPVSEQALQGVCAEPGKAGSFLGRPYHRHSETGFWSVRMNNCGGDFLDELRRTYTSGDLFNLSELHDCMAFDFVRRKFERAGHRFQNICKGASGLEVFEQSPLKSFIRHNKGPDKKQKVYGDSMLAPKEAA